MGGRISLPEISAMILASQADAEAIWANRHASRDYRPAYFNDSQRQATRRGRIAGLEVMHHQRANRFSPATALDRKKDETIATIWAAARSTCPSRRRRRRV